MRVPASGEGYGEARDLHCLLVPAVAGYGNGCLPDRVVGGINPANCLLKMFT